MVTEGVVVLGFPGWLGLSGLVTGGVVVPGFSGWLGLSGLVTGGVVVPGFPGWLGFSGFVVGGVVPGFSGSTGGTGISSSIKVSLASTWVVSPLEMVKLIGWRLDW